MNVSATVRGSLRRIALIRRMIATLRARQTRSRYRAWVTHYRERLASAPPLEPLLAARAADRLNRVRGCSRLRIYYLGTDEVQDRSGLLQALGGLGDLTYFTTEDGRYGHNPRAGQPFASARRENSRRLLADFERLAATGRAPHLVIGQTWGSLIDVEALATIRQHHGAIVVNICMDDRHAYMRGASGGTHALIPGLDVAAVAAPECVEWYLKEGCPALFFPEASDPRIFRPEPGGGKEHDVTFVGARYGVRDEIVRALRAAGVRVTAYGHGWEAGRLALEHVPRVFARSKIVLGVGTIGHCRDLFALKLRDFDGPMSGSLYLAQHHDDLRRVYRLGDEIVTYRSVGDCVDQARYYLDHDVARERIAARGRRRAERDHSWERRLRGLFRQLTLPVGPGQPALVAAGRPRSRAR